MNTDIILDKHKGSITFIVDKDLPEPEDHIESVLTPMEIAEDSLWEWGKPTVYATSKCEEGLCRA